MRYHVLYKRCEIIVEGDGFAGGRKVFKSYENAYRSLKDFWEQRLKEAENNVRLLKSMVKGGKG